MEKIEDLLLSAKEALVKKKIDKSIELFSRVIELEPENSVALFSRGTAYFSKKKYQESLHDFTKCIQIKPDNAKLYCSRGNAWLGLKQNESALLDLNKAIELDPYYPTAYFSRSEVFDRLEEKVQSDADRETGERLQKHISRTYLETQGIELPYNL